MHAFGDHPSPGGSLGSRALGAAALGEVRTLPALLLLSVKRWKSVLGDSREEGQVGAGGCPRDRHRPESAPASPLGNTPGSLTPHPPQRQDRARGCGDPAILSSLPGTATPGCELGLKQTLKRFLKLRLQRAGAAAPGIRNLCVPTRILASVVAFLTCMYLLSRLQTRSPHLFPPRLSLPPVALGDRFNFLSPLGFF